MKVYISTIIRLVSPNSISTLIDNGRLPYKALTNDLQPIEITTLILRQYGILPTSVDVRYVNTFNVKDEGLYIFFDLFINKDMIDEKNLALFSTNLSQIPAHEQQTIMLTSPAGTSLCAV